MTDIYCARSDDIRGARIDSSWGVIDLQTCAALGVFQRRWRRISGRGGVEGCCFGECVGFFLVFVVWGLIGGVAAFAEYEYSSTNLSHE
jgi:hypothetical protein